MPWLYLEHPQLYFNPRSPRGERQEPGELNIRRLIFQSTLPAGGATRYQLFVHHVIGFQSTLPAGGATLSMSTLCPNLQAFQSTLPAGGATHKAITTTLRARYFNPRSPRGERPGLSRLRLASCKISIHAPRGGSDICCTCLIPNSSYFNPRSPRGERHGDPKTSYAAAYFNPRSPRGERPDSVYTITSVKSISIHAPRGGSDQAERIQRCQHHPFQSTLPAGGATHIGTKSPEETGHFNPRSPRGERLVHDRG